MSWPVRDIVILGGGTSGWMTACYLWRFLNARRSSGEAIGITLVEAPDTPTIGVGEATVPNLRGIIQYLGIDEREFLLRTDGTFKQAIRFEQWRSADDSTDYFYHPFDGGAPALYPALVREWFGAHPDAAGPDYAREMTFQAHLCERLRSPRSNSDAPFQSSVHYAYHMDATRFGELLCERGTKWGVRHVQGYMASVARNEQGCLTALHLEDGREVGGDLFIDCSGFRSLLLEGEMGVSWESFLPHLLCDKAVAMRVPRQPERPLAPYTRASARPYGWIWRIPLREREGCGYVYSSAHCSPEWAEQALRREVRAPDETPAMHLNMRTGRHATFWEKNCVAIGLAAGFIEPLESTGIYLTEMGVAALANNFPFDLDDQTALRNNYNRVIDGLFHELLNFITFHYAIAGRDDTNFWREARHPDRLTPRLAELLDLWRHRPPGPRDAGLQGLQFNHGSYIYILAGMRPDFSRRYPFIGEMDPEHYQAIVARARELAEMELERLPDHKAYLDSLARGA